MSAYSRGSALGRYFAGLCEYIFEAKLGVADPPLVDYVSDLLLRFARLDTVHRVRSLTGQPVVQVADMLAEAENRIGLARSELSAARATGWRGRVSP